MSGTPSLFAGIGAQFFTNDGVPLAGGKIYSYEAGTTTPLATYTTEAANIAHTNPIILDSAGRVSLGGQIWLKEGELSYYKFVLKTAVDVLIATYDYVPGTYSASDLSNSIDPELGDALVGFRQSNASGNLTGAIGRTVHEKLQETVSVKDFGAVGNGVNDDSTAIQAAINALPSGIVLIPKGTYLINSNITLLLKGGDSLNERFTIEATGAKFTGTGNIIIDSCKRLELSGFEMPTQNIIMRGCWWSQFNNLMFKQLILNDAFATSFNQSYWNQFNNCLMQNITKNTASTNPANEFTFNSCNIRGNASHGFTTTFDYAFNFIGNTNAQSWKFFGGDVSYANLGVYFIDPTNTSDVELVFNGVYFDTFLPDPTDRVSTIIETHACHNAIGTGSYRSLSGSVGAVTATITNLTNMAAEGRNFRYNGATHLNLCPGGNFSNDLAVWNGTGKPIQTLAGSTVTSQTGGINGLYININQPNTTVNTVFFKRIATPFASKLTGTLVIKNADVGTKSFQVGMFGLFSNVTISNTQWTAITLTSVAEIEASSARSFAQIATTDSTAFNIDVAYIGCHYGISAPFFSQPYNFGTIEGVDATFNPASIPANSQQSTNFTVPGAALGDYVLASTTSTSTLLDSVILRARVSAANTVTLTINNPTSGAIDLPTVGLGLRVWKRSLYE